MNLEESFLNPYEEIRKSKNNLPHWQQDGALYFLTFRQADSMPRMVLKEREMERKAWVNGHPQPWSKEQNDYFKKRFYLLEERILDQSHGSCVLRDQRAREELVKVLSYKDGILYHHISWVIMPNHVHVLTRLQSQDALEKLAKIWKGASARGINLLTGGRGKFWQEDYWDTMIRDWSHFERCVWYIRNNPVSAKLSAGQFTLYESAEACCVY